MRLMASERRSHDPPPPGPNSILRANGSKMTCLTVVKLNFPSNFQFYSPQQAMEMIFPSQREAIHFGHTERIASFLRYTGPFITYMYPPFGQRFIKFLFSHLPDEDVFLLTKLQEISIILTVLRIHPSESK